MEPKRTIGKHPDPHTISLILTCCAISVVFIFLVYSENFVFGSVLGEWTYRYFTEIRSMPLWIPVVALFLLGVIIFLGSKFLQTHEKWVILGSFIAAAAIQIILQKAYYYPMGDLVESDVANSFYSAASRISPYELLSQFQSQVSSLPLHARTNLPGKILFFQLLKTITSSPQTMGYLIITISSLGGVLLYGIVKRLFHDQQAALYAFILYALIPCKQFYFPILNTVTPIFILLGLYLFILYLETKKSSFLILLGIALYALVLFEPSPLVMGILFIGIFLTYVGQKKITKKDALRIFIFPTLSFLAIHLLFSLIFSFNLWQAFQYVLKDAATFNQEANRNYWIWMRENLKAFFFDAGLPIMMLFFYITFALFTQWEVFKRKILQWPVEHLYVSFLILTFAIVVLLGINRGETTRLWIYLAVFFQVPAAIFMSKSGKSHILFFIVTSTLLLQILITLQRVCFIAI